jgi:hypothetical protein
MTFRTITNEDWIASIRHARNMAHRESASDCCGAGPSRKTEFAECAC